jgi:hypothetical protein
MAAMLAGGPAPTSLGEGIGFPSGSNPGMRDVKARLFFPSCVRAAPSSRTLDRCYSCATPVRPVLEAGGFLRLGQFLSDVVKIVGSRALASFPVLPCLALDLFFFFYLFHFYKLLPLYFCRKWLN